jgi:hypothetical protein
MKPHAFIAMPFGTKAGHEGRPIDFDRVYAELIKPALETAGWEVFRADEELRAGDIRTDMFQELLVADPEVADLTLDNPNVWYELGDWDLWCHSATKYLKGALLRDTLASQLRLWQGQT